LGDVVGEIGNGNAGKARHCGSLAEGESSCNWYRVPEIRLEQIFAPGALPLGDVVGEIGNDSAGEAGHGGSLAEVDSSCNWYHVPEIGREAGRRRDVNEVGRDVIAKAVRS
jgi:hypothetical protein